MAKKCFFFYFSSSAKFQGTEFICARRFGLGEMKYNRGGPGARWGDVSTEGKQLFVCLSLTLGLPFISLQGCGAVFTPGQLSFCVSLLCPSFFFHVVFKSITGPPSRMAIETFKPNFCTLSSNYPDSPLKVRGIHSGAQQRKWLGRVVFNLGIRTC